MAEITVPRLDFSTLGELPQIYRDAKRQAVREQTLAGLGQPGPNGAMDSTGAINKLVAAGDIDTALKLSQLGKVDTTDEIKEYKLDMAQRKAAGQPEMHFGDWKTNLKKAGATRVNTVVNSGDKAYDTALNKDLADTFLKYQKDGRDATGAVGTLNLMEGLTNNPNFYSGAGGELVTRAKKAAAGLGITPPDSASANELFTALGNRLVIDASGGSLGAQISNSDRTYINDTVPNVGNTPEGNRQLINIQRKVYERKQDVARLAREYAAKNGGRIDAGFDAALADYANKNPLFKQQNGVGQRPGPAPSDGATATNPQTGKRVIMRGGKWEPLE